MGCVRNKDGVQYTMIAPGGHLILGAIALYAHGLGYDLTITSACDGEHSGPNDPHHRGEAYDVRSHDMTPQQKQAFLTGMQAYLDPERFYWFLEAAGTDNEHFHLQVKKGTVYP